METMSVNIKTLESLKYYIKLASWISGVMLTYEIGIRHKNSKFFKLLQSDVFNYSEYKACGCAKYIQIMLDDERMGLDAVCFIFN
jgi:hypothetical protein